LEWFQQLELGVGNGSRQAAAAIEDGATRQTGVGVCCWAENGARLTLAQLDEELLTVGQKV